MEAPEHAALEARESHCAGESAAYVLLEYPVCSRVSVCRSRQCD